MHPVGEKAENAWGLHDVLGCVYQWVQNWYGPNQGRYLTDPRGLGSVSARVYQGRQPVRQSRLLECFRDFVCRLRSTLFS